MNGNDLIQIKLAVEGMKAQIIKAFDVETIIKGIQAATSKAVDEFDIQTYIQKVVEDVFYCAGAEAKEELCQKYSCQWAEAIEVLINRKIEQALKGADENTD